MPSNPAGVPNDRRTNAEIADLGRDPAQSHGLATYRFGEFVLSLAEGRLYRAGRPVPLAPKPFDTLVYLVRQPARVVPKQELLDRVWADTFVTDDVLVQAIGEVRRALGDHPREPRFVETVPRRGYSFVAPVVVGSAAAVEASEESAPPGGPRVMPLPRPDAGAAPVPAPVGWSARRRVWLAVAGAGVLALLAIGVRMAAPPSAGHAQLEPGTLAVLPVHMAEPGEDRRWLPTGLEHILVHELGQRPGIQVVPTARVAAALSAEGVAPGQSVPVERALQVGRAVRAERVVRGTFQRAGDRFTLRASLIDVASGRVERDESVEGVRADLLDLVTTLCGRLGRGLPAGATSGDAGPPALPPTRSLEAYQAYSAALASEARGGRDGLEEAEARLREAVRLDPDFARAHLKLALVQEARLRWGYGAADPVPAAKAALAREGRLSERDRLLVSGLARFVVDGDAAGAVDAWTRLLKLYPTYAEEAGVPTLVADTLRRDGQWSDLILAAEPYAGAQGLAEPDRAMLNGMLATAFRRKGEYGRALAYARRAVELWPAKDGPAHLRMRTQLGRFLVDAGRRAEALTVFDQIARDPKADVVNVTDAGWGFYMAGETARAAELAERALRLDAGYGNAYHLRGWLRLAAGDYEAAAKDLAEAFRRTPVGFGSPEQGVIEGDVAALYYSGVALSTLGDDASARAAWQAVIARATEVLDAEPDSSVNPVVRWQAEYLVAIASARLGRPVREPRPLAQDDALSRMQAARLYAVMGRLDDSLTQLRQAISLGCGDFQHIRDDPNFWAVRERPEFDRLLAPFLRTSS